MAEEEYFLKIGKALQMHAISYIVSFLITMVTGGFGAPIYIWYAVTFFQIYGSCKRAGRDLNIIELKQFGSKRLAHGILAVVVSLIGLPMIFIAAFLIVPIMMGGFFIPWDPYYYYYWPAPIMEAGKQFTMMVGPMIISGIVLLVVGILGIFMYVIDYQAWKRLRAFFEQYVGDPAIQQKGMKQSNNVATCALLDLFLAWTMIVPIITLIMRLIGWFSLAGAFKQLASGPGGYGAGGAVGAGGGAGGGYGETGYGGASYGGGQPAYGSPSPSYGSASYGSGQPAYGSPSPSYGSASYGGGQPAYGSSGSTFSGSSYGGQPSYGSGGGSSPGGTPATKTCSYCGNQLPGDATFCGKCGTSNP